MIRLKPDIRRDAAVLVGLLWLVIGYLVLHYRVDWFTDALAYFGVDPKSPYAGAVAGMPGSFLYTPVAAQIFIVLKLIPEPHLLVAWTATNLAILAWLVWPRPWVALALAMPVADELITGQIELILALAIVIGFRRPVAWCVILLTKVSPGLNLVWFVVRREWRSLALALGVAVAFALFSFALAPSWWLDWIAVVGDSANADNHQMPWLRFGAATLLTAWAARTDRVWVVPIAVLLALPVIYVHSLVVLLALVRLPTGRQREEPLMLRARTTP